MNPTSTQMSPEIAKELEKLKDIRLPDEISWWPLATGWWVLIAFICALALAAIGYAAWRRRTLQYRALHELGQMRGDADLGHETVRLAERIEILLKRVVLEQDTRRALAASHGETWMQALIREPGAMPADIARFITDAPYVSSATPATAPRPEALINAAERWIRRNT